jgi:hypothetical protein
MGSSGAAPINEAVSLLSELDPTYLEDVRRNFPLLSAELVLGKRGGEKDADEELNLDRARVMLRALEAVVEKAQSELLLLRTRISASKRRRLWSQIASLICSSGVLAAIPLGNKPLSIITALLALLTSVGTMISDHKERLLKQDGGDIYDAYESASQASYKAGLMAENMRLLIKHKAESVEIRAALESSNMLCEELNNWITKMSGSR